MAVNEKQYDLDREITWCPGCGNFAIMDTLKKTLAGMDLSPDQILVVAGIGQAGKMGQHMKANTFHVLHGRLLPVATGAGLINNELKILAIGGDGDGYAEGGNHLIHAARRNVDLTYMVHNNMIYGLTKGQASPTSEEAIKTPTTPRGNPLQGLNPISLLLGLKANFVARSFAGDNEQLKTILEQAIKKPGFAFIDILQQCPSFNKINTFKWFKERVYDINASGHDSSDLQQAFKLAQQWGEKIPTGIFYNNPDPRPTFREAVLGNRDKPLTDSPINPLDIKDIMEAHL